MVLSSVNAEGTYAPVASGCLSMGRIKLISTDYDGTLVAESQTPPFSRELVYALDQLRDNGVLWAINTGRRLPHLLSGMEKVGLPIRPDYVLTNEREVFRRTNDASGWEDFGRWNHQCALDHDELYGQAKPLLVEIERHIEAEGLGRTVYIDAMLEGIIAESVEHMERAVAFIDDKRTLLPQLSYQRNAIYLRFCHTDYHKGAALRELGRLLRLDPSEIFAVGDNYNDLSMLEPDIAAHIACPGNAIDPVKEFVRERGGHISEEHCSDGVVTALRTLWPDLVTVRSAGNG